MAQRASADSAADTPLRTGSQESLQTLRVLPHLLSWPHRAGLPGAPSALLTPELRGFSACTRGLLVLKLKFFGKGRTRIGAAEKTQPIFLLIWKNFVSASRTRWPSAEHCTASARREDVN
jgi:hypothetical protein